MSSTQTSNEHETQISSAGTATIVDMKLEVVVIPVSDIDRAKRFYTGLGWRLDADLISGDGSRVVQLTPHGSPCSIHLRQRNHDSPGGVSAGTWLIVSDIEAARAELIGRGVEVSGVFHFSPEQKRPVPGHDPQGDSYRVFAAFSDPDGNGWLLQQITSRLPGRLDQAATSFDSADDLASAMRRAAAAHGEHEKRIGKADANWPDWYAAYMVAEQAGRDLPA
jgi:catechol 2,3-dioxygenase-like lactoylglutathione lyase family enzyme